MTITAKYAGKCAVCSQSFAAGAKIEWNKGSPARHTACAGGAATRSVSRHTPGRMGSGHGSAAHVPGYSSYCTDNASCRCFDCAS